MFGAFPYRIRRGSLAVLKFIGNVLGYAAVFGLALLFAELVMAPMEKTIIACHVTHGCD